MVFMSVDSVEVFFTLKLWLSFDSFFFIIQSSAYNSPEIKKSDYIEI